MLEGSWPRPQPAGSARVPFRVTVLPAIPGFGNTPGIAWGWQSHCPGAPEPRAVPGRDLAH